MGEEKFKTLTFFLETRENISWATKDSLVLICIWIAFLHVVFAFFLFIYLFIYLLRPAFHVGHGTPWPANISQEWVTPVGPMHYLRDPQTSFFSNFFIKIEFYGIIHIFKNYFVTCFFWLKTSNLVPIYLII